MEERYTVIVSAPDADACVAAALAGRACDGPVESAVFSSEDLVQFFRPVTQQKLPRGYDLLFCGPGVAHLDWDGRLVRPRLMEHLRKFIGALRWFSNVPWAPEDRRAVAHLIGEGNLTVSETAPSLTALVRDACFDRCDEYEEALVRFASGRLTEQEEGAWGAGLRKVLTVLKGDRHALASAVADVMEGRIEPLIARHAEGAERTETENRRFAGENAREPSQMGSIKLVRLSVPLAMHAFWEEVGRYAREASDAELSLCRLEGRPVLLLACAEKVRTDLRAWARYVTDMLPGSRTVGARARVVPLMVEGLAEDAALEEEVLALLADGAHLLRG